MKKYNIRHHRDEKQAREDKHFSLEERNLFAEVIRERIYSTITLLAVLVTLWQHVTDHTVLGVIGTIIGTVITLWLATIISARISYKITHEAHEIEPKMQEAVTSARGLLMPAGPPIFFTLFAAIGLIQTQTALTISIASLIFSLFFFSMISYKRSSDSLTKILLYSSLQMLLGVGVVILKVVVE